MTVVVRARTVPGTTASRGTVSGRTVWTRTGIAGLPAGRSAGGSASRQPARAATSPSAPTTAHALRLTRTARRPTRTRPG
jgi:hypothetical protein